VRAAGGSVPTWHGERGARELLGGIVIPDSYLAVEQPRTPPLHLLLEIDRGTEDRRRLLTKARRYAKAVAVDGERTPSRPSGTIVPSLTSRSNSSTPRSR
jgi:hypothetical protein